MGYTRSHILDISSGGEEFPGQALIFSHIFSYQAIADVEKDS
jgi:hypothetical protein